MNYVDRLVEALRQQLRQPWRPNTSGGESYRTFFQNLIDRLRDQHRFTQAQKGLPQGWYSFASGMSGVTYAFAFGGGGRVRVEFYIDRPDSAWNKAVFDQLIKRRDEIEAEVGEQLTWQRLDEKRASRISASRPGAITDDAETLGEITEWAIDQLLRFRKVFGSRLPAITATVDSVVESPFTPLEEE
jgi:hypothetical protein